MAGAVPSRPSPSSEGRAVEHLDDQSGRAGRSASSSRAGAPRWPGRSAAVPGRRNPAPRMARSPHVGPAVLRVGDEVSGQGGMGPRPCTALGPPDSAPGPGRPCVRRQKTLRLGNPLDHGDQGAGGGPPPTPSLPRSGAQGVSLPAPPQTAGTGAAPAAPANTRRPERASLRIDLAPGRRRLLLPHTRPPTITPHGTNIASRAWGETCPLDLP